jgi:hypothetical protein
MLPPLSPLRKQAGDGQLCQQGTIFHSAANVVGHCHPHYCHQHHCRSKQGRANNAKAPSSVLPPLSSSRTVVCTADVVAITQQGEEQVMCQGTIIHAVATFCHRALLDTPLQLLQSCVVAKMPNSAKAPHSHYLGSCSVVCAAAIVAAMEEGKEWSTMPRHCRLLCRHLSVLPPLSLSTEQARDGQQCQKGTIFRLPLSSSRTAIHAAAINPITQASKEQDNAKAPSSAMPSLLSLRTTVPIADLLAIMGEGKGWQTMVPRHHLLLSPHRHHAPSFTLLPLMALHKQAGNGKQCQDTVIRTSATIIFVHSCSWSCCLCHCKRGQGMGNNVTKAPSSALPPSL